MHRLALAAALLIAATLPASSIAAPAALPAVKRTAVAKKSAQRDCQARTARGKRGVATTTYKAPMAGFVTVRSAASDKSDWDLALFDARSGRALGGSAGFGSHEVAQTWVGAGQRVLVQSCRRKGAAKRSSLSIRFIDAQAPKASSISLVRIAYPSPALHRWLDDNGFDVTHNERRDFVDVLVPGADKLALLEKTGIKYTTRVKDMAAYFRQSRAADRRYAARVGAAGSPLPTGRTAYRTYDDYQQELKQIVADHGDIARPLVIGKSFQGREIQGIEISDNVSASDDGKPTYFVMGVHHAREWPSGETAMEFAHLLADGYAGDAEISDLLKKERVVIVPLVNPDGFFTSRGTAEDGFMPDPADSTGAPEGDTVEGVGVPFGGNLAYRRKNCDGPVPSFGGSERDYPCYYQWGVDPNRNYGEGWGGPGASPDPNTQVYRGDGQWSEPETQAIHKYSQEHPVTAMITMHTVAALVLRPPGLHAAGKAPDEDMLKALGDKMADYTGYTSQYGFELYDTSGTTEDWNYAAAGSLGYTIEIGPLNGPFHGPYEEGVVDQWVGPKVNPDDTDPNAPRKGGMRAALLAAAHAAADDASHSVLEGTAPAGRVLRVKKTFDTKSGHVCTLAQGYVRAGTIPPADCIAPGDQKSAPDKLEYTTVVPASGQFNWHITQSTRPFVEGKYIEGAKTDHVTTFSGDGEGSAPAQGETREYPFDVSADDYTRALDVKLDWTLKPEDYDLYLYYVDGSGTRTQIGTANFVDGVLIWTEPGHGQNPNGLGEHIEVTAPPAGHYIAAVENTQGVANDYTLTIAATGQKPGHREATGNTESWTLTCETPEGQVLETRDVVIGRGERSTQNLDCGGATAPGDPGSGAGENGAEHGTSENAGGVLGQQHRPPAKPKSTPSKRTTCLRKANRIKGKAKRKRAVATCRKRYPAKKKK